MDVLAVEGVYHVTLTSQAGLFSLRSSRLEILARIFVGSGLFGVFFGLVPFCHKFNKISN